MITNTAVFNFATILIHSHIGRGGTSCEGKEKEEEDEEDRVYNVDT